MTPSPPLLLPAPTPAPPTLRLYQQHAIGLLAQAIAGGSRAPLLVAPTGSGKTVIAAEIMRRATAKGRRVLFCAPRRELIWQTSEKLAAIGVRHGIVLAGADHRADDDAAVQVASVDTLYARVVKRATLDLGDFDLLIIDECHLSITEAKLRLFGVWPRAIRLGLTATPTRKDGRALGCLFDRLLEPTTVSDLTAQGFLMPARYYSVSVPDLGGLKIIAGDYQSDGLETVMNRPQLVGDIVAHWLTHGRDRRTVVFACSIAHSAALAEAFRREGVCAEHVDAETPREERERIFARFRSGETEVLTNCFLAAYGFDLPVLSCVVLARPTRSLMLFLQMLGRGLRPAPDKTDCLVLDHSGAVHEHGFAADLRPWTLDGTYALTTATRAATLREQRAAVRLTCQVCDRIFTGSRVCPECGWVYTPTGRDVVQLDGTLVEIAADEPDELGSGSRGRKNRQRWYLELRGLAAELGYRTGWAAHQYKARFRAMPPWAWNSLAAQAPGEGVRRWWRGRRRGRWGTIDARGGAGD